MQSLQAVLGAAVPPDWTLTAAHAISADGRTIAGTGRHHGLDEAFVAQIGSSAADFNADGFLDFTDFDGFVSAFEAGAAGGDFNADGFLDFTDFDAFIAAFEVGG
ncbi:MAG: GC-type dockerin domain-anchored protein [Planctomycetota bacterium]|nr:GC-type dockerin domain-anchored protein [Planctomycetota bacterium]